MKSHTLTNVIFLVVFYLFFAGAVYGILGILRIFKIEDWIRIIFSLIIALIPGIIIYHKKIKSYNSSNSNGNRKS